MHSAAPRAVRTLIRLTCACMLAVALVASARAQDYPARPIRLIVPFTAGSVQDLRGRHIGGLLGARLGQPFVVENRPGGNGAVGSALVAQARPDGYTLLLCTSATISGNPALMPDLPYRPLEDFIPVVRLVTTWGIVAVDAASAVRSFPQLLALARLKPGTLRYGSGASYSHILGALLSRRAQIELLYVPYKGDGQVLTDLLGGHIDLMLSTGILLVPQAKAGRIRALAVAGPRRLQALPDVPTIGEQGVADSELPAWAGICAPAKTPPRIVERLNHEALAAMMAADTRAEAAGQGYEVAANTPDEFLAFVRKDMARTARLVQELGIPPEQ